MTAPHYKIFWPALRRKTPDPRAPSTPPRPILHLLNALATGALVLSLPVVIPWTILRHIIFGPRLKWMDFRAQLVANIIRIYLLRFSFFLCGVDSGEWSIPQPWRWRGGCRYAPGVKATLVRLPPATTPREGFAVCDAVPSVVRPGFMLAPKGMNATARAGSDEKAILYFVGGAYAFGHPLERPFSWAMAENFGVRVLGPNYRKVLSSSTAFPAPLIDCLAGWDYLTRDLGFKPANITFVGESAGGHMCFQLSRYLADIGQEGPGALALSGPWCDLGPTSVHRKSMTAHWGIDYIPWIGKLSVQSAARHYTEETTRGPYFAPVHANRPQWQYLVGNNKKVYIHYGEMELLVDEIRITVKNLQRAGVDVQAVEEPSGVHISPAMLDIFPTARSWEVFASDVKPIVRREY